MADLPPPALPEVTYKARVEVSCVCRRLALDGWRRTLLVGCDLLYERTSFVVALSVGDDVAGPHQRLEPVPVETFVAELAAKVSMWPSCVGWQNRSAHARCHAAAFRR